jgi:hypothetical protein
MALGDREKCGNPVIEINNIAAEDCTRKKLEGVWKLKTCGEYKMVPSSSYRNTITYLKSSSFKPQLEKQRT